MRKEPSWKSFLLKFTFKKVSEKTDKKKMSAKMKSQLLAWAGIKKKKE